MTMATTVISPGSLVEARHAAEERHLRDLFDAYETFCAYSDRPESWRMLALQLTLYLDSEYTERPNAKLSRKSFQLRATFPAYLRQMEDEQLGYLASDIIIALFHSSAVLNSSVHLAKNVQTSCVDVVAWEKTQGYSAQMLVRKYLQKVQYADLYYLIDGVKDELSAFAEARKHCPNWMTSSWAPCSDSHIAILSCIELKLTRLDAAFLKDMLDILGYPGLVPEESPIPNPGLLERATVRAALLLGVPRHSRNYDTNSQSLQSIMEEKPATVINRSALDADGPSRRDSKRSSFSDYRSFITALSHRTGSSVSKSYFTAASQRSITTSTTADKRSTMQTFVSWPTTGTHNEDMANLSQWSNTLKQRDVIPDPELENWSLGRGQHAEYLSNERDLIPLTAEDTLGETSTALVESVRCMRVRLVRKTIRCNRRTRLKREDALQEVQGLYRAQHSHVVRLVGTYIIDDEMAILTYPCAEWNLEQFLAITPTALVVSERTKAISKFFTCLAKALDFLHSFPIKHMDIKPQNILVRIIRHSAINGSDPFKIYLTDFGSSRFYPSIEDSETDNWTPFTRAYAAQEVVLQERRGLSADIFSMGCVYAEMLATILDGLASQQEEWPLAGHPTRRNWNELTNARSGSDGKPRPYYLKLDSVCAWLRSLTIVDPELIAVQGWVARMLDNNQTERALAREIAEDPQLPSACVSCTLRPGPEDFEAANPPPPRNSLVFNT